MKRGFGKEGGVVDERLFTAISKNIDGYREEVIWLQRELTSRPALGPKNGGQGEHEKVAFIKTLLERLRPDSLMEIRAPDPEAKGGYRPNLLARWESDERGGKVWVLSHSDIVPPGDLNLWDQDPYEIKVEGDKIYGRGVEDNQHGFVSSYLGLKAILEYGLRPLRSVGLVVVADEETGSRHGLEYLLENHPDIFSPEDLIIVPDGGNEDGTMIEIAEKSILWIRFEINGKQCHASTPQKGKNSLIGAAALIMELQALRKRFDTRDELFRPPVSTFEPTKIETNVPNINTIPGRDVFHMDCRILPQMAADDVLTACQEIASSVGNRLGLGVNVEVVFRQDAPPPTSKDSRVVIALSKAIEQVTGKKPQPMGIGGGTVAAFFRRRSLPAAVWLTSPDTAHQPNEYCLIPDILSDAKVLAYLYLGMDEA